MKSKNILRLLIVDDDFVDGECLVRNVKKRELECETKMVRDGGEALEFLRTKAGADSRYQTIVILDINMPGINGHEFLAEIRNDPMLRSTIVFVFTSSSHERDIVQAYQKNVAGFFVKANMDGLLDTLVPYSKNIEFPIVPTET